MMADNINDVDIMDEMMGGAYSAPGDEMVSSAAIVSVPRGHTAAELHRNGNNSSNTNPDEPLVPPPGLTSRARPSNDSLNVKGARNIGPSQRPGAYTARGRAVGSRPAWHRRMSARLAAPFRQGSRRTTASERQLPHLEEEDRNDDEQAEDVNEDDNPNLVVAAEISPDTADLEAEVEKLKREAIEIKKQLLQELLQGVTAAEVVEERKEQPPSRRRCVWILLGLLAALLLIIVGVVVGVAVASHDEPVPTVNKTPAPTASPTGTLSTSPKFTQLLSLIGQVTSDIESLQNITTLQYAALNWLANVDDWEVDIDSVPPQVVVERYVLALLYYSTNGTSWRKDYNFLTPTSVCDWSRKSSDDIIKGVICDGIDYVSRLEMGTYGIKSEVPNRDQMTN
jgi:hypothetical protein